MKIGSLWRVKDSKVLASGTIEIIRGFPQKIVLFSNDKKEEGKNQPDINICLGKDTETQTESKGGLI